MLTGMHAADELLVHGGTPFKKQVKLSELQKMEYDFSLDSVMDRCVPLRKLNRAQLMTRKVRQQGHRLMQFATGTALGVGGPADGIAEEHAHAEVCILVLLGMSWRLVWLQ